MTIKARISKSFLISVLVFLSLCCFFVEARAEAVKEISLNGLWKYISDPEDIGVENEYFQPGMDYSNWEGMKIPGNWAVENPEMFSYAGKVWFSREFKVDKDFLNARVIHLEFEGVDYFASVWLNGHYLGKHEGYFSPFDFNVKQYLNPDSVNILVVCVDSPKEDGFWTKKLVKGIFAHHDCRPPEQDGNTGGIWNNVKLVKTGWICFQNVLVETKLSEDFSDAEVRFDFEVKNCAPLEKEANFKICLGGKNFLIDAIDFNKSFSVQPDESNVNFSIFIKNPKLWWTWDHGKPNLYNASISVELDNSVSDTRDITFGVRKIEFDTDKRFFYLNGKRMFQRGTNYIATQWLSTFNEKKFEKDILMMIDANLNSVRVHAHVLPQEFYTICDEKGMLVWADFPLIWGYVKDGDFIKEARRQFKEYIREYYNHPSIWLWCISNEGDSNQNLNDFIYLSGRKIDKQRAFNKNSSGWDSHIYHGWYGEKLKDYLSSSKKFVSEYGAQGIPLSFKKFISQSAQWPLKKHIWQYHNFQLNNQEKWIGSHLLYDSAEEFAKASLMYQYDLLKFATEHFRRTKYNPCGGLYQFMFVDCWPSITWAVVDYYRQAKPAYYALKEAMLPVLLSIRWEERFFEPGDKAEISLWCINDYMYPINDGTLSYKINDSGDKISYLHDEVKINLEEDSSKKIKDLSFIIPSDSKPGDIFKLSAQLKNADGKILSTNRFVYRVGKEDEFVKDLSGDWLFKKGDDPSYCKVDTNEKDWGKITVPGNWEEQGHGEYNGFAWYRKHISIPKKWITKKITLYIENIDDCDELYFNGEKVNSSGILPPDYKTAFGQNRLYPIPKELIKTDDDNVIALRVFDNGGGGGIVGGPVKIGDFCHKYIPVYINYPGIDDLGKSN
ncbi:MAG: beta galactosidase jelly roll domain-containing protein [Candidatus Aureabacteria bacterium]|nr:beta galactosidase jelly roll domain-containing protein [Candidatus Auribacterota bacterium]